MYRKRIILSQGSLAFSWITSVLMPQAQSDLGPSQLIYLSKSGGKYYNRLNWKVLHGQDCALAHLVPKGTNKIVSYVLFTAF